MSRDIKTLAAVVILILASFFSLYQGIEWSAFSFSLSEVRSSDIQKYHARYDDLKAIVPANATVGYITHLPTKDIVFDKSVEATAKYFMTQYALAPILVDKDRNYELVVANFNSPGAVLAVSDPELELVKEFGNGVGLFRREAK